MSALPLAGLDVVEFAGLGPAPHAAMMLGDLGADIVRVHRPDQRSDLGGAHQLRGRTHCEIDLKSGDGLAAAQELIARADVLIEGFRPGVMERLGLGPSDCVALNPCLIYVRVTGWGQSGPWASKAGHDINYLSVTGVLDAIGPADAAPVPPLNLVGDFGGGSMLATVGLLAALFERSRTGRGGVVDAAIVDGVSTLAQMMWEYRSTGRWNDGRASNRLDGGAPYYTTYAGSDGRYVAVGALEPKFWEQLILGLGLSPERWPDREDPACWQDIRSELTARFAERTRDAWIASFEDLDACVTPVLTFAEAVDNPHLADRGTLRQVDGGWSAAPSPRFSDPGRRSDGHGG